MSAFTTVPASIQYTISMLTLPLVRSRSYTAAEVSAMRSTLQKELMALASTTADKTDQFELHLPLTPARGPPKPLLMACVASGVKWPRWILHLGGKPVEFVITRNAVLALFKDRGMNVTLWQREKPTLPSYATGILGMKEDKVDTPLPQSPVLKGLDALLEERGLGEPITPMTALPSALSLKTITLSDRAPSPISSSGSEYSDDDDSTFSDVSTSYDDTASEVDSVINIRRPSGGWLAAALRNAASAPQPAPVASEVVTYNYSEGETRVLSGGVMLGLPSLAAEKPEDRPAPKVPKVTVEAPRPASRPFLAQPKPIRPAAMTPSSILSGMMILENPPKKAAFKAKQRTGASEKTMNWRVRA